MHKSSGSDIQRLLHPISCSKTYVLRRRGLPPDLRLVDVPAQVSPENQHHRTGKETEGIQTDCHLERIQHPRTQSDRGAKGTHSALPGERRFHHNGNTHKSHFHLRQLRQIRHRPTRPERKEVSEKKMAELPFPELTPFQTILPLPNLHPHLRLGLVY